MSTEKRYKLCTANCIEYRAEKGELPCRKGNFAFEPLLGGACAFGVLEGELEKSFLLSADTHVLENNN